MQIALEALKPLPLPFRLRNPGGYQVAKSALIGDKSVSLNPLNIGKRIQENQWSF